MDLLNKGDFMIKNISYKFRNKFFFKPKVKKVIIFVIIMLGVIVVFPHFFRNTYIVTIENKRVIDIDNTYLIYTQMEDGNTKVFENNNSLLEFKIHSEDVYWGLRINRKYEIKAYGLNIPLLSYYQNIISVKGVK